MTDQRRPRPFHERFGIEVGTDEARRQFINRVSNLVFDDLIDSLYGVTPYEVHRNLAQALGEKYDSLTSKLALDSYVGNDFYRCLKVLETLYRVLKYMGTSEESLSKLIDDIIQDSEIDLGISWQPPIFVPTGAKLLDERLVNDPLHWLDEPKYKSVYDPFKDGLSHFLESQKKPHLLKDVITDMYEAVEALAKIVTGRFNDDLSANRQLFIKNIKASKSYKWLIDQLLKDYIAYANDFRHAEDQPGTRPVPSRDEVESFMYLTGLFIRLAVQPPY
jgi:hypothetical protein